MQNFQYLKPLNAPESLPALNKNVLPPSIVPVGEYAPRILMLYGSLRERSYSRLATEEAARILKYLGAEVRIFDPRDLPLPDQIKNDNHPAVQELREHAIWSEGMVWCSPERHGNMTAIMKAQIDHLPLSIGAVRPTQGRNHIRPHSSLGYKPPAPLARIGKGASATAPAPFPMPANPLNPHLLHGL